jgi:hypothetical protein
MKENYMRFLDPRSWFLVVFAAVVLTSGNATAQTPPNPAAGTVTFTVTVAPKKDASAAVSKDDVQLFLGKERKQVGDWKKDDRLFLAILIDDSIDNTAASNWNDLKAFIDAQPPTTMVAVGYIRNNVTMLAQDFTDNHELAGKALRIPMGIGAIGSSPYLAMIDLLKRWPNTGPRRSIMLISSGIDYFRGGGFGAFYPDLDPLIQRAERQNTNIWSVYFPSAGHRGHSFWILNTAQNNLSKLSEDTGAESFYLGLQTPVSLKPYFDEIGQHLSNQYLLTFAGSGGTKGKYQSVKVKTEVKDVEFFTPAAVYLPGTGK